MDLETFFWKGFQINLLYFGLTCLSPLISNMRQVYYKYSENFVKRINESSSNQPGTFALFYFFYVYLEALPDGSEYSDTEEVT